MADVIERHGIKPFEVTLDSWTIVPHVEAIEAEMKAFGAGSSDFGQLGGPAIPTEVLKQQAEIDDLIAQEEEVGRIRLRKRRDASHITPGKTRRQKKPRKGGGTKGNKQDGTDIHQESYDRMSPQEVWEQQQRMFEEFNGPCLICVEPNEESGEKLKELRSLLCDEIFGDVPLSPASYLSLQSITDAKSKSDMRSDKEEFRPLIPVGDFPTVESAIEVAKAIKSFWDPLTFTVSDLHLMSMGENGPEMEITAEVLPTRSTLSTQLERRDTAQPTQYGCDAAVMFVGEEIEIDDEITKKMFEQTMEEGVPCAGDPENYQPGRFAQTDITDELDEEEDDDDDDDTDDDDDDDDIPEELRDIFDWLDDGDDPLDEGAVVVVGRTHFFEGEMRLYDR